MYRKSLNLAALRELARNNLVVRQRTALNRSESSISSDSISVSSFGSSNEHDHVPQEASIFYGIFYGEATFGRSSSFSSSDGISSVSAEKSKSAGSLLQKVVRAVRGKKCEVEMSESDMWWAREKVLVNKMRSAGVSDWLIGEYMLRTARGEEEQPALINLPASERVLASEKPKSGFSLKKVIRDAKLKRKYKSSMIFTEMALSFERDTVFVGRMRFHGMPDWLTGELLRMATVQCINSED